MVLLRHIFSIVHLQLASSFLGACALRFITEQNKTTEAFVGTNQTFSWNLSLDSSETSKELTFRFGLWDSSHYTVMYYLATVIRELSGNENITRAKDHSIGSRLYWVGNLTHGAFIAFRLINIQHSDKRQYGIIIKVDGAPPDEYQRSFKLLVKDPPPLPTKGPGAPSVSRITQHPSHISTLESPTQPKDVYYPGSEGQRLTMYLSVAAVLAVFVIGFFLLHRYLIKRCRRQDCEVGETNNLSLEMVDLDLSHDSVHFTAVNQAFSRDLEVPRENLNIEKVIGCGAFGVVSRAFALNLPNKPGWTLVAVKSISDDASEKEKRDLLSEMCVLKQLEPHPHVIQLYGYVTSEEHPLVLVEYAPHGDLLGYLRKSRGVHDDYYSDPSVKPHTSITSKGLLKFSWEISDGMAYLSSKKIIHRDLAARNVLVGDSEVCKITDFGMARDVHEQDIYVRTSERRLPIKWTAPEALFGSGSYTTASDVWSFGVVLYEIFTVGCDPFPGAYMRDIPKLLNTGYRMPCPRFISQTIYSIMMDCWMDAPAQRPSFQQLRSIFGRLLEDQLQEYVNLKEIFYENVMPSSY